MTDLTNRTAHEVNELIQKYAPVLEVSGVKTVIDAQILVILVDIAVKYIQEKYNNISTDLKAWSVVAVKQSRKKIKTEADVKKIIDDFIEYYKTEFEQYRATMCDYPLVDLECNFVHSFTHKKIGSQ
mgnify:CR=1 FL=1